MENVELLAVYGTLKSGHINHYYLDGAEFIAEGAIEKDYGLMCDELPFSLLRKCIQVRFSHTQTFLSVCVPVLLRLSVVLPGLMSCFRSLFLDGSSC